MNIYRVKEVEEGNEHEPLYAWRWVWKRKGPDHYAIADVYALVGIEKYSEDLAQIIGRDKFMAGVPIGTKPDGTINANRFGNYKVDF